MATTAKSALSAKNHPWDFIGIAKAYCEAADDLLQQPRRGSSLPVIMLYFHAIEAAYKAFLRGRGYTLNALKAQGHNLEQLHLLCVQEGLDPKKTLGRHLKKLSSLLTHGVSLDRIRYTGSGQIRTIEDAWAKDVARGLIDLVTFRLSPSAIVNAGFVPNYLSMSIVSASSPKTCNLPALKPDDLDPAE